MLATSEPCPVSVMAKQPGIVQAHDAGQPLLVVFRGAEVVHCGAEQAPLDAGLDLQRRVGDDQLLEAGDVAAVVIGAAHGLRECAVDGAVVHQDPELPEGALAVFGVGLALDLVQFRAAGEAPGLQPDVGPLAEQLFAKGRDVDGGRPRGAGLAGTAGCCGPAAVCRGCGRRRGALPVVRSASSVMSFPSVVLTIFSADNSVRGRGPACRCYGAPWPAGSVFRLCCFVGTRCLQLGGDPEAEPVRDLPRHGLLAGLGRSGRAGEPLFAGVPHQADRGIGPVADHGFLVLAAAQMAAHGPGNHVADGGEEVAQAPRPWRWTGRPFPPRRGRGV